MQPCIGPVPRLLAAAIVFSLVPDLDFLPGLLIGEFSRFHNTATHSFLGGLVFALAVALLIQVWRRGCFLFWFLFVLACYQIHVIMDFFTWGRGLMLFWPLSVERIQSPIHLFYGLHRSDGWMSVRHVWTFVTELTFAIFVIWLSHIYALRR